MTKIQKDSLIERMTENLPTLRAKASLSQGKLAEIIGVSRQTLCAVESKSRKMSWSTFLSCILVFQSNKDTRDILKFYEILTDDLKMYLKGDK